MPSVSIIVSGLLHPLMRGQVGGLVSRYSSLDTRSKRARIVGRLPLAATNGSYVLTDHHLKASGRHFEASASGDTVLEAAQRAGVALPYSCRAGVCGSCKATAAGTGSCDYPRNQPLALNADEPGARARDPAMPGGAAAAIC